MMMKVDMVHLQELQLRNLNHLNSKHEPMCRPDLYKLRLLLQYSILVF